MAENRAAVLVRAAEDVRTGSGPWFLDGGRLDHDYNAWGGAELEAAGDGRIKVSNAHAWTEHRLPVSPPPSRAVAP